MSSNNPFIRRIFPKERPGPIWGSILDIVHQQRRDEFDRSNQISLGELARKLEHVPDWNMPVTFEVDNSPPGRFTSYRGYYDELALERGEGHVTARDLLDQCHAAIGDTFHGYKGGEYTMGEETPVWASEWGEASNLAITGVNVYDDRIKIVTEEME